LIDKCPFCDSTSMGSSLHPKYIKCSNCLLHVVSDKVDFDYNTYYNINDEEYFTRYLDSDRTHYNGFISQVGDMPGRIFNRIWSFGGGFPKLETYLNYNKLMVFDMIADKYELYENKFNSMYQCTQGKIKWHNATVSPEFVVNSSIGYGDLISFVHFLEHFDVSTVIEFIDAACSHSAALMIYQPEITAAGSESWVHFLPEQHVTLISVHVVARLIESKGFNVIHKIKYSDDFFIYAEKKK
jgi:hypothetical protein